MTGVDRIRAERQRQLDVEGYSIEHDAVHGPSVLCQAAVAYLLADRWVRSGRRDGSPGPRTFWPFEAASLKLTPDDRVRELAKAGALIAAAIDAELARLAEDDYEDDDRWHETDQDWQHPETVPDRSALTGIDLSCPSCGAQPGHPHDATCKEVGP